MENKQAYKGLSAEQVEESRRLHGNNVLTPPQKASLWSQFLEKFEDPIIRILLVAWLLSMIIIKMSKTPKAVYQHKKEQRKSY